MPTLNQDAAKSEAAYLAPLNAEQRQAVEHGVVTVGANIAGPLLVIAGAGTGKTDTIAHRVAHLIVNGADPGRILLLTFSRRAAAEMERRVERIVTAAVNPSRTVTRIGWSGTFHAVGARLLRSHANAIGLEPSFTIHDRQDSQDLMNLVRHDRGLSEKDRRFPLKDACLAIYSRAVNAGESLEAVLLKQYPWCAEWKDQLCGLFEAYVETAGRFLDSMAGRSPSEALAAFLPPAKAACGWRELVELMLRLHGEGTDWLAQLDLVRRWYQPHLERRYPDAVIRIGDLDQLQRIAAGYPSCTRFLTDLTLDPPAATSDQAGAPLLDEDYLILSTIHSAKGQEWKSVFVLNVIDGCIPSEKRGLAYNERGRERNDLSDQDCAIADYTKMLELDPKNAITYNNRAWAYFTAGKPRKDFPTQRNRLNCGPITTTRWIQEAASLRR